ncbi:DUF7604 domain-containing protein [Bifidobacterium phasiani]|uniref:VWA domain-containing protein n=1 Tax=Bifidobacterium phasiani TaxID=2834431 RepID=A0ABS6W9W7_9BIFI|nr:VWA domain-containing protein [Bifidobacterium phasiani]MBW3083303.1 VWA domain-containing protein [Bifidobacterium phasiani]
MRGMKHDMKKAWGGGIRSRLVAAVAALAMLGTSVAAGTAVASELTADDAQTPTTAQTAEQDTQNGADASDDAVSVADVVEPSSDDDVRSADAVAQDDGSVLYAVDVPVGQGDEAGSLGVEVTVPSGALPDGVALVAGAVADADAVSSALAGAGVEYDGLLTVDVRFEDTDGNEVEPSEPVSVRFDTTQSVLGGDVDASSIAVRHLAEDADGAVESVDMVADAGDQSDGTVSVDGVAALSADETADADADDATVSAEFTVDSFSSFTITWRQYGQYGGTEYFNVTMHYVDQNGEDVNVQQEDVDLQFPSLPSKPNYDGYNGQRVSMSDDKSSDLTAYRDGCDLVEGCTGSSIHYGSIEGPEVTSMTATISGTYVWQNIYGWGRWNTESVTRTLTFFNDNEQVGQPLTYRTGQAQKVDIYFVCQVEETGTEDPDTPSSTDVTVTTGKTAVLRDNGDYDLTLSVSGDRGSSTQKAAIDVLFIVDRSGSMTPSRQNAVDKAVDTLISTLQSDRYKDSIDARYGVVAFAGSTEHYGNGYHDYGTDSYGWTSSGSNTLRYIKDLDFEGGTNYQQAIYTGKEMLANRDNSRKENATTFVIFISDGIPTYRGVDVTNGTENRYSANGNGSNDNDGKNIAAAVNEISSMNCDYFYAIGMGDDFGQEWQDGDWPWVPGGYVDKKGTANLKQLANAVDATYAGDDNVYSADDEDLSGAFGDITASITFFAAEDVVMSDPLSDYADIVAGEDGQVMFSVKLEKQNADGSYAQVGDVQTVTSDESAQFTTTATTEGGAEKQTNFTITPSYDEDTKTITASLSGLDGTSYELAPGYRYSISTVITPSQAAINAGMNSDVAKQTPNTGTGTHADRGETGFWSNDNENAKVTYTANGESGSENFPKPVIRVADVPDIPAEYGTDDHLGLHKAMSDGGAPELGKYHFNIVEMVADDNGFLTGADSGADTGLTLPVDHSVINGDGNGDGQLDDGETAGGEFDFGEIEFDKPGTYYVAVSEEETPAGSAVVYDESVLYVCYQVGYESEGSHVLKVTGRWVHRADNDTVPVPVLTEENQGTMWHLIAIGSTATDEDVAEYLTWTNIVPVSSLPLTGGDTTARTIVLAGGCVLLLAGVAWLLARRRRV